MDDYWNILFQNSKNQDIKKFSLFWSLQIVGTIGLISLMCSICQCRTSK